MEKLNYKFLKNNISGITNTILSVGKHEAVTLGDVLNISNHSHPRYHTTICVFGTDWALNVSETDFHNKTILVSTQDGLPKSFFESNLQIETVKQSNFLSTINTDLSTIDLIRASSSTLSNGLLFVPISEFERVSMAVQIGRSLMSVFDAHPVYKSIVLLKNGSPQIGTIVDILSELDASVQETLIQTLSYTTNNVRLTKQVCDKILEAHKPTAGLDLLTQEEQIAKFLEFSKQLSTNSQELVSDKVIEHIKNTHAYNVVLDKLTSHGFGVSDTQQFNVLQQVGIFAQPHIKKHQVYNLSDMGAGKTLMTVESIFLLDMLTAQNVKNSSFGNSGVSQFSLPNKNIIAPTLSLISSWVKTFELFYKVSKVSDHHYTLQFEHEGISYTSNLYLSGFTVKVRGVAVTKKLPPTPEDPYAIDYLIIDEIHQLVSGPTSLRSKFLSDKPEDKYMTFVLSGTLSNLTTHQWFNLVQFLGTDTPIKVGATTPATLKSCYESLVNNTKKSIFESTNNLLDEQQRYFDPTSFGDAQLIPQEPKMTNLEKVFHMQYSPKVVHIPDMKPEDNLESWLTGEDNINILIDPQITESPNFELFYNIVGSFAVTAQSSQIAEELFGDQKTQHNANVIKTPSELTANDIEIVKVLHKIANDYRIYKSPLIASKINNAILNLNDGLSKRNIYELLTDFASSNTHFLKYLSGLDLDVLEKLPSSNLIYKPELTDTVKFKILCDLLDSEKDETHLIVVNDYDTGLTLSKALGIGYITKEDFSNQEGYQDTLDALFEKQSVVIVPQSMIKSSLDLVQANRLIQYQLNENISDIIQTQNRINRIGQTRETKAYYIATDTIQDSIIHLFLETYKNIKVAHKGIVELFVDMNSQINVVNDYIDKALGSL